MSSTLKRVAAVTAVGAMGILAPVAGASAATPPYGGFALPNLPVAGFPAAGFPPPGVPAFRPPPLSFVGPSVGQVAAVIGPTILTTAPSDFTNTNIQVSPGPNLIGGQAAP